MSDQELTLSQAAAECGKWGSLIRALAKVEESAKVVLGVEQNITERTALRDKLGGEIASAQAQLVLELEALEKARTEARELTDKARADARAIKADAREAADKLTAAARDAVEKAEAEKLAAQAERATALADADAFRAELTDTVDKIEAAKAEARKLFGGP